MEKAGTSQTPEQNTKANLKGKTFHWTTILGFEQIGTMKTEAVTERRKFKDPRQL